MANVDYEAELDATRIKLYEETKDLTNEERVKRNNERLKRLSAQYGFKIGTPSSMAKEKTSKIV